MSVFDAVFSATLRVAVSGENSGAALAPVVTEPDDDQALSPSSLLARTWTSYVEDGVRPVSVVFVVVPSYSASVKAPALPTRYCTS